MARNLTRHEPWDLLDWAGPDMSRLFGRRFLQRMFGEEGSAGTTEWMPAVDIEDGPERILVRADIPGIDAKDIHVSLENGMLTLSGERRSEAEEKGKDFMRVERAYGKFLRSFALPQGAEADKITATARDGVLEVVVPKSEKTKSKQIEVKTTA